MSDKRVGAKVKGKVNKRVVRPAIVFGFRDRGTDQKIGNRSEGGRVKDVAIVFASDGDGQDQKPAHQRDSTGQMIGEKPERPD